MGIVVVVCGKICGKMCGKMCDKIEKLSDWNKNWCGKIEKIVRLERKKVKR